MNANGAGAPGDLAEPVDDGRCIACGLDSPIGLKMRFRTLDDGSVESTTRVSQPFQGWRDVVHGGVVAMLLDEAMAYAAAARGWLGVTGELRMRFRRAVPVDCEVIVRGEVLWQRRTVLGVRASVRDARGVLATGEGSFVTRGPLPPGFRLGERRGG